MAAARAVGRALKKWGFFLRAETMHGFYSYLADNPADRADEPDFHALSHGESFLAVLRTRFNSPGLLLPRRAGVGAVVLRAGGAGQHAHEIAAGRRPGPVRDPLPAARRDPGRAPSLEVGPWGLRPTTYDDLEVVGALARLPRRPDALPEARAVRDAPDARSRRPWRPRSASGLLVSCSDEPEWTAAEVPLPDGPPGRIAVRDAVHCGEGWWAVGGVLLSPPTEDRDSRPAAWRSTDGTTWEAVPVGAQTYWGRRAVLSGVGCSDGRVVAVGARSGGAHGNPRVTSFFQDGDGLDDQLAPFNLFNGDTATNVGPVTGAAPGWLITGNRVSGPAVWHSTDGRDFTIEEDVPGLADEEDFHSLAQDAAWDGEEWVVVGGGNATGTLDREPLAWTSPDARSWERHDVEGSEEFDDLQRVAVVDSTLVALGLRGGRFGSWLREGGDVGDGLGVRRPCRRVPGPAPSSRPWPPATGDCGRPPATGRRTPSGAARTARSGRRSPPPRRRRRRRASTCSPWRRTRTRSCCSSDDGAAGRIWVSDRWCGIGVARWHRSHTQLRDDPAGSPLEGWPVRHAPRAGSWGPTRRRRWPRRRSRTPGRASRTRRSTRRCVTTARARRRRPASPTRRRRAVARRSASAVARRRTTRTARSTSCASAPPSSTSRAARR